MSLKPVESVAGPAAPATPPGKAERKAIASLLHQWQAPRTGGAGNGKRKGKAFSLAGFDPAAKPFSTGDKLRDKQAVENLAVELDGLQNLFYADRRYKLLVILQGTDTSGKDGT